MRVYVYVCAYFHSSLIANDLRHIFSYVIWLSGDGFKFVLCLTHTSPVTYNMTEGWGVLRITWRKKL